MSVDSDAAANYCFGMGLQRANANGANPCVPAAIGSEIAGADIAAELSCNLTQIQSLHSLSLPNVDHIHIDACAREHLGYLQIDL